MAATGGAWRTGTRAPLVAMFGALGIFGKQDASGAASPEDAAVAALLKEADDMYASGNKMGVRKLLDGKHADVPEVLWRLARAYYDCAEVCHFRGPAPCPRGLASAWLCS